VRIAADSVTACYSLSLWLKLKEKEDQAGMEGGKKKGEEWGEGGRRGIER